MSLVADALQPFLVKGLIDQKRPSGITLADLIGRQEKIGFDLDFDNLNESICFDFRDTRDIIGSVALDISRFASASFQTIRSMPTEFTEKETIPWAVIRTYYAAFYAGQALIRLFGESCSYFDREHIARISELGKIYAKTPEFRLSKSVYHCVLNNATAAIDCKSLREGAGGAHEAFWNVFGIRINTLSEDILTGSLSAIEAQAVFSKMNSLYQCIRSRGAPLHSWLSVVRNEVQYRHSHDVWLPCVIGRQERQQLGRLVNQLIHPVIFRCRSFATVGTNFD